MRKARILLWSSLGVAAVGASLAVIRLLTQSVEQAFDYLAALGFVSSTILGGLALMAMTYVIGARWFVVLRRICLTLAAPTAFLPLSFVPIALTLRSVYAWAGSPLANTETITASRRAQLFGLPWLSAGPFLLRTAFYCGVWVALAEAFRRAARAEDQGANSWFLATRSTFSAVALPALGLSGTWAAFDWLMSAVPGWNMTSVGLYVLTGGFASALGVLAVLVHYARREGVLPTEVGAAHSLALGRLLFAAVCLWAYVAVSQLIIVWVADLPREAAFYVPRAQGAWRYVAGLLVFGHFLMPFLLLLSRTWKERSGFVAGLGAWVVVMHAVDVYWLIVPSAGRAPSLLDIGLFLFLGALAVLVGVLRASDAPAPLRDPELARSLGYESP